MNPSYKICKKCNHRADDRLPIFCYSHPTTATNTHKVTVLFHTLPTPAEGDGRLAIGSISIFSCIKISEPCGGGVGLAECQPWTWCYLVAGGLQDGALLKKREPVVVDKQKLIGLWGLSWSSRLCWCNSWVFLSLKDRWWWIALVLKRTCGFACVKACKTHLLIIYVMMFKCSLNQRLNNNFVSCFHLILLYCRYFYMFSFHWVAAHKYK